MVRKMLLAALALILIAAALFFALAPGMAERDMNRIVAGQRPAITPAARALHRRLAVADLHGDTLLWKRSLVAPADRGQIDLPRLRAGNVTLQVFSSVTKTPKDQNYAANSDETDNITLLAIGQLQPVRTWGSLLERSLFHADKLRAAEAGSAGALRVIDSPAALDGLLADRRRGVRVTGALLSIEGLHNLEGRLENIDRLHAAGFRMAGLAHFFDNEVAGSMHGIAKGGLTPLGRQVVRQMEARGMIVDIAHASHPAVAEVLAMARRPVVSSHGGVQAVCRENRNLTDAEIRGVARTGGVVGIGYWDGAVCSVDISAIVRSILHVRDLVGIDHVGLGSDFDGAVTTGFDTGELVLITQGLMDAGLTEGDIAKVMGGNVLRVLRAGIAPLE